MIQHIPRIHYSITCILGLFIIGAAHARSWPVDSLQEFTTALKSVQPGDSIVIADGQYENWSSTIDVDGTEAQPILIRAETAGKVIFSGFSRFGIRGSYIQVSGLVFDQCSTNKDSTVEFEKSAYCRLTNSTFQHSGGKHPAAQFRPGAKHNVIENCQFIDIAGRSVHVQINGGIKESGIPEHNVIRNNLFKDIPPLGENGRETVKIGQNQPEFGHIKSYTLVEGNTFIRCNGEAEIISNKASNNTFRHNTFLDCEGELVMRGGSHCLIEGNRFSNCRGGIRLSGTNHTVVNNVVLNSENTGIRLLYGMTREQGGHYRVVSGCLIANNTIVDAGNVGILIGDGRNKDWKEKGIQKFAPENNRISNNLITSTSGNYIRSDNAPDNQIEDNILR